MKYELFRDRLNTGDLVLFYGKGFVSRFISWGSRLVKFRFKPAPSHIGVVVKGHGPILLLESTTLSKTKTYYGGVLKDGPQLVSLSSRFKAFKGRVTVRHLEGIPVTPVMEAELETYRRSVYDRTYERSMWEVARSSLGNIRLPWTEKEDDSSLFCSELVTDLYKCWGLFDTATIPNRFAPVDYADGGRVGGRLLQDARLAPEVTVQ